MWLEVLSGEDAGRVVEVTGTAQRPFVLGRVQGSDLVIRDARASRRHVALMPGPEGGLRLEDLGSANGTLLDGAPVREATLRGGETLEVGGVRIAVLDAPPPATGTAEPGGRAQDAAAAAPLATAGLRSEPSLSALRRLGARNTGRSRGGPVLLAAAGVAVGAALVLLISGVGGRTAEERAPEVVRAVAPATVMVLARRDGAPVGPRERLAPGFRPRGDRRARGQPGRRLLRRHRLPAAAGERRRRRPVRGPGAPAGARVAGPRSAVARRRR